MLIINTKGGGHANIGLHLAKQLLSGGHQVTIVNDGSEEKIGKSGPYAQYGELKNQGVTISYTSPQDPGSFPSQDYDVVIDNNGKDLETCQPIIDHFKGKAKQHIFIASAGAYKGSDVEPLLVEGDERKGSAGHVAVEKYLASNNIPHTVIHPQYIYGPYTAKFYEDFFLDRLVKGEPVPLPLPGIQLTSLTHVEDVAQLIAKAVGNDKAINQHFNASTDRFITFRGVVNVLANALGQEPKIAYYDPSKVKLEKGQGIPFRTQHFIASPEKAKTVLGFQPQHSLEKDAPELIKTYKDLGKHEKADTSGD